MDGQARWHQEFEPHNDSSGIDDRRPRSSRSPGRTVLAPFGATAADIHAALSLYFRADAILIAAFGTLTLVATLIS